MKDLYLLGQGNLGYEKHRFQYDEGNIDETQSRKNISASIDVGMSYVLFNKLHFETGATSLARFGYDRQTTFAIGYINNNPVARYTTHESLGFSSHINRFASTFTVGFRYQL